MKRNPVNVTGVFSHPQHGASIGSIDYEQCGLLRVEPGGKLAA
jgi:hypothetical protein